MENLDIRTVLPLLQQMGISPDTMGPEKLQQLMMVAETITDPSQINQNVVSQLKDILGLKIAHPTGQDSSSKGSRSKKVPRNAPCSCNSGIKWKKCCGKPK